MILDKLECLDWCFGSLIENIVRGKVAEFIVFSALGGDGDVVRSQWEYADLTFGDMKSIGLARLEDRSTAVSFADLRGTVLRQLVPPTPPSPPSGSPAVTLARVKYFGGQPLLLGSSNKLTK